MEVTQMAKSPGMEEQNVVCTYNGILFNLEKQGILSHTATWISHEDWLG
jgi:hypothetical protein